MQTFTRFPEVMRWSGPESGEHLLWVKVHVKLATRLLRCLLAPAWAHAGAERFPGLTSLRRFVSYPSPGKHSLRAAHLAAQRLVCPDPLGQESFGKQV